MMNDNRVIRKHQKAIFHWKTTSEDEPHLTEEIIRNTQQTGRLNLSGKNLLTVPSNVFHIYDHEVNPETDWKRQNQEHKWWYFESLKNVDLSSNLLVTIPGDISIFGDITVLNIENNKLETLPVEIGTLKQLKELYLSHNKLEQLPKEFYNLDNLQILKIDHNNLKQVSIKFSDLVMLTTLDLAFNKLTKLPLGTGFLVRLIEFKINHNQLKRLPEDFANLRSLSTFDGSYNQLEFIPDLRELLKLKILILHDNNLVEMPILPMNLEQLELNNNKIVEVQMEFQNLPQLKELNLCHNSINEIDKDIALLQNLRYLNLQDNQLETVPNSLALLPHLQTLLLERNSLHLRSDIIKIGTKAIINHLRNQLDDEQKSVLTQMVSTPTNFDASLDYMYQNRTLFLTMKNLTIIPETVFKDAKLAQITTLDLCKNRFKQIPDGLQELNDTLLELNLSQNLLEEVPEFLSTFTKLKFLDLSRNCLHNLPASLSSLKALRELNLSGNRLTTIPDCIFGMIGLEILLFNENQLTQIPVEGLIELKRLSTLNLSNNSIQKVPPELGNCKQLKELDLKGNCFKTPRYAILEQGTETVLCYLRDKISK